MRRPAEDAAVAVQAGEHRHPDARVPRGRDVPLRHLGTVAIGRAVGLVVQVVELRDRGEPVLQQLGVELRGDGLRIFRREAPDEAVHRLAPGPEAVAPGGAAALRPTGHGALEGVGVEVGHARDDMAGQAARRARRASMRSGDGGDGTCRVHLDHHVAGPAAGQQRMGGEEAVHAARHGRSSRTAQRAWPPRGAGPPWRTDAGSRMGLSRRAPCPGRVDRAAGARRDGASRARALAGSCARPV
jgi:hypothetical protein